MKKKSIFVTQGITISKLPSSLQWINQYAFYGCKKITISELPKSYAGNVSSYAFTNCIGISSMALPKGVTGVYQQAFSGCTGLTVVRFHEKPSNGISSNAFYNCTNLANIYVPWKSGAVSSAPWGATNATVHYETMYPAASVSMRASGNISKTETSYDCNNLLTKLDEDGYEQGEGTERL